MADVLGNEREAQISSNQQPVVNNQLTDDDFVRVPLDELASEKIDTPKYSYWGSVAKAFFSKKVTIFMLVLVIVILGMSFIQPLFSGYSLNNVSTINDLGARYNPPSAKFWFGTDGNGQSLFDAIWAGARTSISVGAISTVITMVVGVIVGGIWGVSKRLDKVMLEVNNVISNIPGLLIVIVLSYTLGNGFWNLIFAMTCTSWLGVAYGIRVYVMMYRDREYNIASQTLGTPTFRIVTRNILPYLTSVIMTSLSTSLSSFIDYEVFLSFVGVGLSQNIPSLGRLIADNSPYITSYPYLFWFPVLVLALLTVSLYIVGQNLADASDPRTHM
ncbi:peptide ABC transporter permease [Lacticaseibacillus paracasei subsp. paracasei Lpp70]|uniref:Peptide ABC transporter permease n=1 Tax=Lacticaseibacillus paracasei subsp. paracasei Lpp7 TaxID=1256200 RepID=A0A8E0IG51_LACPA|nr:peptide ABC transporter permease [Lacticaseibacillus paracasei subsp. paracasei Lpp7]EPD04910.1 peptide ABC transporter permease [Lacticaseibacillus paracasei subsp. paracasei Lpp70]